jgi:hypothetical protein
MGATWSIRNRGVAFFPIFFVYYAVRFATANIIPLIPNSICPVGIEIVRLIKILGSVIVIGVIFRISV